MLPRLHHTTPRRGGPHDDRGPGREVPPRRRALACLGALTLAPLVPLPVAAAAAAWQDGRALMGTWVSLEVADGAQPGLREAADEAFATMQALAAMMSRFAADSALSGLNRAAGRGPVQVPPALLAVLEQAQAAARRTDGAFDPTVGRLTPGLGGVGEGAVPDDRTVRDALPHIRASHLVVDRARGTARLDDAQTQLDLGGIAKLHILDAGLQRLAARGIHGVLLNGGGDVLATPRADGREWRVGLRDPAQPDQLLAVLPLRAGVVASSGDYERFVMHEGRRYHHIIDPATGRPTRGLHGVTLVGERVDEVNALGTAAMVAGWRRAPTMLARCGVQQALLVADDGRVHCTPALAARLQPPPGRDRPRGLG